MYDTRRDFDSWCALKRLELRIISRTVLVATGHTSACWIWTGSDSGNGYGKIRVENKSRMTHRVLFTIARGGVPRGFVLDHLCRVRSCVNPWHLEPVTVSENTRRGNALLFRPLVLVAA